MKATKPDPAGSVNHSLAEFLSSNKEGILTEWRERVLADSRINVARSINTVALTNRLPFIFDDLIATLRRYRSIEATEACLLDSREHGAARWRQGYELSEVMYELKHFRAILIYYLKRFEGAHLDHGMAALLFVTTILHRFIDEMAIEVTEEYLSAQLELQEENFQRRLKKKPLTE